LAQSVKGRGVIDGELLVGHDATAAPFNALQQRLNRKTVDAKMIQEYPAFIRAYDMLFDNEEDIRVKTLRDRRVHLENWLQQNNNPKIDLSPMLSFSSWEELGDIRRQGAEDHDHEGIMIKRKDSIYVAGRPKGEWYKWKRNPCLIDAVLMYAQRGHGKRSSFYSDYTFGVWDNDEIVPVGKAYFGFTDEELLQLDKWIRSHTTKRYGPVREVERAMVFEVAFDSIHESARHKSGVAMRFPRINRIRWDKPAAEADALSTLQKMVK
jgi:DNA ligase-1